MKTKKVTIEINPEVLEDLLSGCNCIIRDYRAQKEYYDNSRNPVPEEFFIEGSKLMEKIEVLSETKDVLQKAYDEYSQTSN